MARGLDHIVHAVRDLDAAADLYERLGFTVGPRNRHPWGTQNRIVQLPGFFIELLTVAEPEMLIGDGLPALFGAFNDQFLQAREGFSFLMLESTDAVADAEAFQAAHIGVSGPISFERAGTHPDGNSVTVGFTLAFARDSTAPQIGFAVCQQHHPENFWNASSQRHPNGASAVIGAVLVAENPSDHHIFLSALSGQRELNATSSGISAPTPRGEIRIVDPDAFHNQFGLAAPDLTDGPRLAALVLRLRQRDGLLRALQKGLVPFLPHMQRIVIAPQTALGATLVFDTE
jgi:hypothetical protein